ncbi:hypothetical protein [Brevibacillus sp. B_LB10_24]|uniref:hypothetical protein n=1 Tax=Brevibacillus sp. B_LB10_24 TaxID=3380645 RepID=UPI0038B924F5
MAQNYHRTFTSTDVFADRYQDLALAIRSVIYYFGRELVPYFLEAYGIKAVDESKVRFYQLLDEFY